MPDQATIQAVYDFENIIPDAIAGVLNDSSVGMTAATIKTANEFQKIRPRCEVMFQTGMEAVPRRMIPVGNQLLNAAWKGNVILDIITDSEDGQKPLHGLYLSMLRFLMPLMGDLCNGSVLPKHKLQFQREAGTSMTIKTDDGYWKTTITFEVDVSVQADALQTLAA